MARRANDKQRRAWAKRYWPRTGADGNPVNFTRPSPPPAKDETPSHIAQHKAPGIIVRGSHPPPHILSGADMMADDRVCDINKQTGRVKLYRRLDTWRPHDNDKTSQYIKTLLDEIRRLRVQYGEPEFDN